MKNTITYSIFLCVLALIVLPLRCIADTAICHVVDPAGKPVANATVYSVRVTIDASKISTVTTDKTGGFTVDNTGTRPCVCVIDAPGFAPTGGTLASGENTFHLSLPTKLTGKVLDLKGQPVTGAVVIAEYAVISDGPSSVAGSKSFVSLQIEPLVNRYTVKTDSTGTYILDDLPANSEVTVELNDPRFVLKSVRCEKGAATAPPITALIGTSISGKVVREDGKPIGSALRVIAALDNGFDTISPIAKVAADGTYMLTRAAAGSYTVGLLTSQDDTNMTDWAVPAPVNVIATLDTPGTAPDLVLTTGGVITGSVLAADTKKPIPGVLITIRSGHFGKVMQEVCAKTGADGKFSARVWAGKATFETYTETDDYVDDVNLKEEITSVAGQTVTINPILLKRSLAVTGVAVDVSGKPVSNVTLDTRKVSVDRVWMFISEDTTNATGSFTINRLTPGEFWIDPGADWTVVSPKSFTVPAASPIKLVLKKNVTTAIQGTVVDTSNAPIAGVDIKFTVYHNTVFGHRIGWLISVTSGADGKFTLPDAPVDAAMIQRYPVAKDGYVYKSGGDIRSSNGHSYFSPIVMAQLGSRVNGIVYNGLGKPVANAWVFCPDAGLDADPVKTDAAGHFVLSNVVGGSVNIYAAKGLFFSQSSVQASMSSSNTILRLPAVPSAAIGPANLSKAIVMLTKNINDQMAKKDREGEDDMRDQAAKVIAEVNLDAAVNFILSTSSISTGELDTIVSAKLTSDPLGVASWALVPLKRISGNRGRGQTAADIGLAVAPYDAAAATPYYDLATQYIHFDHIDEDSIIDAMSVTALAYSLHRPEADDDYAKVSAVLADLVKKPNNDPDMSGSDDFLPQQFVRTIALGNVDKAIAILETLPTDKRYVYVCEIISELIKPNPSGAMALYHWVAQDTASNNRQRVQEKALCLVLPIIYKTDPKGAAVQAHSISSPNIQAQALTELADLIPLKEAAPFYQNAEEKAVYEFGTSYTPACIAYHAWERDQVLGTKLFTIAYKKFTAATAFARKPGIGPSRSDFAFYYSHIDPAFSRILLEEQFPKDNQEINGSVGQDSAQADVAAMCAIDIHRAAQMAESIKYPYQCYTAGLKIAEYVLLTPQQRNALSFSQWGSILQIDEDGQSD
jgi:hypothetical protein